MKRIPIVDAINVMDGAMRAHGYSPFPEHKQHPNDPGSDVRIRLYRHPDRDGGVSLAVTHEEIIGDLVELGRALTFRINRAVREHQEKINT